MGYVVLMNNKYMTTYRDYASAFELRERLERKFPRAIIEIITSEEFERRY